MNAHLHPVLAVAVAAGGPLVLGCDGGGSPGNEACTVSCGTLFAPAAFNLSCGATDLTNVAVSGPCARDDGAGPSTIQINSPTPGVCHVELTFATGFTYSTDVTFSSSTQTGCCVGTYVSPTQSTFTVNNPEHDLRRRRGLRCGNRRSDGRAR